MPENIDDAGNATFPALPLVVSTAVRRESTKQPISAAEAIQPIQDGFLKLLRREPALGLSVAYLLLTAIGITYDFWYYAFFGIDILQYADVTDFLFAAIREPIVIAFTVLSAVVILSLVELDYRLRKRFALYDRFCQMFVLKNNSPAMLRAWTISAIVVYFGGVFTPFYAKIVASKILSGRARPARISIISDPERSLMQPARKLVIIGTTSRFIMIYNPKNRTSSVIPIGNVALVSVSPPSRLFGRAVKEQLEDSRIEASPTR